MRYIYKITNKINKKVYIGQTNNPTRRFSAHKNKSTTRLGKAIQQDGKHFFKFEVLCSVLKEKDTDDLEIFFIAQYDSRNTEKGYNVSPGGLQYPEMTEEVKLKLKEQRTGTKLERSVIEKIIKKNKKRVYCHELDVVFFSIKDAASFIGIKVAGNISLALKHHRIAVKGYTFSYYNDISEYEALRNIKKEIPPTYIAFSRDGEILKKSTSLREISNTLHLDYTDVCRCVCKQKASTKSIFITLESEIKDPKVICQELKKPYFEIFKNNEQVDWDTNLSLITKRHNINYGTAHHYIDNNLTNKDGYSIKRISNYKEA
ncbi:MAG: GIY-YIG nuclease family protein [Bacteroidales bacterium]